MAERITTNDGLPPDLAERLAVAAPVPPVPDGYDDRVLERSRSVVRRRAVRRRAVGIGGTLAAASIAVASALWFWQTPTAPQPSSAPVAREDLDRSGDVDIRDALHAARALASGERPDAWDFTSDGAVDQADVDHVARLAVRLNRRAVQ